MQLKKLTYLLLTLMVMGSGLNINAQKKSGTKAVTKKTTTGARTSTGGSLNKELMEDAQLIDIRSMDNKNTNGGDFGGSVLMYDIYLLPDNVAVGRRGDGEICEWKYAIKGNTLELGYNGKVGHSLVSYDQGKTFKRKDVPSAKIYNIGRGGQKTLTKETMENALEKGGYICYLNLFKNNDDIEMMVPVTVKATPDEDEENKGIFKVTSESKAMTQLGAIKLDYEFADNKFLYNNLQNKECDLIYSEWKDNYFYINLGSSKIGSVGVVDMILMFIKK